MYGKRFEIIIIPIISIVLLLFISGCEMFGSSDDSSSSTDTSTSTSTSDTTAPSVTNYSPGSGATGVDVNANMCVSFSEPIAQGFTYSMTFSGGSVDVNPSHNSDTVCLQPKHRLDYETQYTMTLSGIKDGIGNNLGTVSWSVTTASSASFTYHITPDSHNSDVGQYNSIAISPVDGKAYIAYKNTTDGGIYVIFSDGNNFGWWDGGINPFKVAAPANGSAAILNSAFAIDNSGNLHIVYQDTVNGIIHAVVWTTGGVTYDNLYSFTPVSSGKDASPDIAIDSSNGIHISFYDPDNTALRYFTNINGGVWQNAIVDTGESTDDPGYNSSIEINSGIIYISYYDYHSTNSNGNLKYVRGYMDGSGVWVSLEGPITLDSTGDVGEHSSLALYNGSVYIAYYDGTNSNIKLITNASGSWISSTIVSGLIVSGLSAETLFPFIIEPNGIMHMGYFNGSTLYYASKSWGWQTQAIDSSGNGFYTSITVDGNGKVRISYYDATDHDLKYAHQY
ncbi:MAG: Ig-like domain-containing protein [Nitrospirae bacterium]|nr:Ig-like domain-containing protein [Nitrospirota bacterium]